MPPRRGARRGGGKGGRGAGRGQPEEQPAVPAVDPNAPVTQADLAAMEQRYQDMLQAALAPFLAAQQNQAALVQDQTVIPPAPVEAQPVPVQLSAEAKHLKDFRKYNPKTFDGSKPHKGPNVVDVHRDYLSAKVNVEESWQAAEKDHLSHILFADDILLFVEDKDCYIKNLQMALSLFEKASRLRINLAKSIICPVNVHLNRAKEIAIDPDISCQTIPLSYLRVPLGGNPNFKPFWRNIEDKIQKKLNNWKYAHISKGGKLTLIKSILSSLPIYRLSEFQAPSTTCNNIEKFWRKYLWKDNNGKKESHLVNWSKVTKPKEERGLGIPKLHETNQAFLTKWFWRFYMEPSAL
ncbi:LINE-1 retrotransposable element ORF2 protein [Cucumis melo var. makuwa]|uniref:LINE-1 retrotransposable element ORF2 protein n=1 Tax=Cucumis melo var. makuwa TaxID=1194695 RepID=A0A5A7SZW8_CUCMM|nr:LINE-1 retrotransposable element ORF2 protein [Cucumis melo var. makuwa]TYK13497.1 LINE-1 retrotransposable element ORF2 protein [Cucumis melo var. makuwa]